MRINLNSILRDKDLMGTLYVTVGGLIGAFFSYLLQFFLGRLLSVEDYGSFNALLSISYLIGVPAGVLSVSLVKNVAEILSDRDFKRLTFLFIKLSLFALFVGSILFLIIYLIRGNISNFLKIYDPTVVTIFGITMGLSFLNVLPSSYLQGLLRYKAFSAISVAGNFFRFIFPTLSLYLGFKLYGVFGGMVVGSFFTFVLGLVFLKKNFTKVFSKDSDITHMDLSSNYKKILMFGFPVMFVNFGMMFLNNMDLILVKRYFDPFTAGLYAGTVTLGKILLFGAGSVATVMFPRISSLIVSGGDVRSVFSRFMKLQLFLVSAGVLCYLIFPRFIINTFFGKGFMGSVSYLPLFALFIGSYVLVNFLILFFLAINKTKVYFLLIPSVIIQFSLINYFHDSLYDVIKVNIFSSMSCLLLLVLYFYKQNKDRKYL